MMSKVDIERFTSVNACEEPWKRLHFYPFKDQFLARYATPVGLDLQVRPVARRGMLLRYECWLLNRHEINGRVFHTLKDRLIAPRGVRMYSADRWVQQIADKHDVVNVIRRKVDHREPTRHPVGAMLSMLVKYDKSRVVPFVMDLITG
jgi:hypothetical protein